MHECATRVVSVLAVALLVSPLASCTLIGAGLGAVADANRKPRRQPPSAIHSLDQGEQVTIVYRQGTVVRGRCFRQPPENPSPGARWGAFVLREDGRPEPVNDAEVREVWTRRPAHGVAIGAGIGLAVDVTVFVVSMRNFHPGSY